MLMSMKDIKVEAKSRNEDFESVPAVKLPEGDVGVLTFLIITGVLNPLFESAVPLTSKYRNCGMLTDLPDTVILLGNC